MIRLVFADLWMHARVWLGMLLVTIATGSIGTIGAGLIETGNYYGGDIQYDLVGASTILILLSTVTALIVLSSTADLAVSLQQRSYALWQLAGMGPVRVAAVVLAQLAVIGSTGAVLGWATVKACAAPIFGWLWGPLEFTDDISAHLSGWGLAILVVAQVVVVLVGGFRGARTASRVSPIEALRTAEATATSFGWLRLLLLLALTCAAIGLSVSLLGADFETISGNSILLIPLFSAVLAVASPIVFRPVLKVWTFLIPARWSDRKSVV